MRTAFMQTLIQAAQQDPNLYLLVGDVGFSVIEEFQQKFQHRYINAGIAEQSMIGLAAGLAMAGKNVFVYSIVPFVTMRCFEQVRDDLCYQNLPVKIVGTGAGLDYGSLGGTHHSIEDMAIMRCIPGMTVLAPGSFYETQALTKELCSYQGPAYLRLSRSDNAVPYATDTAVIIGSPIEIIPNAKRILITTGNMLDLGYTICKTLQAQGINLGLVSMPTIKPLNLQWLQKDSLEAIYTLEEHNYFGGMGEAIGAYIAQNFERKITFKPFAINDEYCHVGGKSEYLRQQLGLSLQSIESAIKQQIC